MTERIGLVQLGKEIIRRFFDDEVPALGAQMTFYLILSLFPFLIFLLTLTAYTPLKTEEITATLVTAMPESAQSLVLGIYWDVMTQSNPTLLSFGMIASIWTASSGMMALIRTINKAYDEPERRPWLKVRFLAIIYTVFFAAALLVAFALLVFGGQIGHWLSAQESLAPYQLLWSLIQYGLSLLLICALFCLVYVGAPARRIRIREALPGAVFATLGWVTVSFLFSLYVGQFANYTRTYGSLGGIIVLLLWLYLSSIILLLGGEINAVISWLRDKKQKTERSLFGSSHPRSTKN